MARSSKSATANSTMTKAESSKSAIKKTVATKPSATKTNIKATQHANKDNTKAKVVSSHTKSLRLAPLATPTDLSSEATKNISAVLNSVLADVFALYLKTKNFHWHLSGPHFRDYHLMYDEQGAQLFAMTDPIAERVRKVGGKTLKSIGQIAEMQSIMDNNADYVEPLDMLAELCEDNKNLNAKLRRAHEVCDEFNDVASASLIENWIDETERRTWFLFEANRKAMTSGH